MRKGESRMVPVSKNRTKKYCVYVYMYGSRDVGITMTMGKENETRKRSLTRERKEKEGKRIDAREKAYSRALMYNSKQ